MINHSRALFSVAVVTVLAACGGGGSAGASDAEAVAATSASSTAAQAGTTPPRSSTAMNPSPAAGAIQTASPGSATDIAPTVDPLVAHRVHAELDQIEQALRRIDTGKIEKQEALEVVGDARSELDKERPNRLKLRSLLAGLAQGAQALDGMKGAGRFLGQLVAMI